MEKRTNIKRVHTPLEDEGSPALREERDRNIKREGELEKEMGVNREMRKFKVQTLSRIKLKVEGTMNTSEREKLKQGEREDMASVACVQYLCGLGSSRQPAVVSQTGLVGRLHCLLQSPVFTFILTFNTTYTG